MRGLEGVLGHAEQVVPQGVEVDGLPQPGGERGHDGFDASSAILPGITEGWPRILSDLKTLLETGDTLIPA